MLSQEVYYRETMKYFNKALLYFFVNGKENSSEFDILKNKIENKYFTNEWCTHTFIFYQLLIVHKQFKLSPLTSVYHLRFSSERSRQTLHSVITSATSPSRPDYFYVLLGEKRSSSHGLCIPFLSKEFIYFYFI